MTRGISRSVQRGSRLLPQCRMAAISKHEYGTDDIRCFCYGIAYVNDCVVEECERCGAYAYNAKPSEEADDD